MALHPGDEIGRAKREILKLSHYLEEMCDCVISFQS